MAVLEKVQRLLTRQVSLLAAHLQDGALCQRQLLHTGAKQRARAEDFVRVQRLKHMTAAGSNAPWGVVSSAHERFAEGQALMTTTALARNSFAYVLARCMTSVERPTPPLGDQRPYTVGYSVLVILPL